MNDNLFNLTPEMELLLACCGISMKQDEQERKESYERLSVLISNGYQRELPDFALTPRQKKALLKTRQHVSYYHPPANS